jgi:predicted DNA binding CopG/RHH family protein
MANVLELRADIQHVDEAKVVAFVNTLNCKKYAYCKEISKISKKQHFHLMIYTKYHVDSVRRKLKTTFNLSGKQKQFKAGTVKNITKYLAYIMKDGDYIVKNISDKAIEEAIIYMENVKEEQDIKTLKEKCINYLNKNYAGNRAKIELFLNSEIMMAILNWFKEKGLTYPSQTWLKNTMVTYLMQREDSMDDEKNIAMLYNIRDPFIKND